MDAAQREAEAKGDTVRELLRTNDVVRLSFLQALLADADIAAVVLDAHTSVLEGSINAIPRRLMVGSADFERARHVLELAGEAGGAD